MRGKGRPIHSTIKLMTKHPRELLNQFGFDLLSHLNVIRDFIY